MLIEFSEHIDPTHVQVHGQYPKLPDSFLGRLPPGFTVQPDTVFLPNDNNQQPMESNNPWEQPRESKLQHMSSVGGTYTSTVSDQTEFKLSCNYNMLKTIAAMFQIIYGSFQLYAARERQIVKFGYAAYAFTVVPYILMSFINSIATICEAQYPSVFIVSCLGIPDPHRVVRWPSHDDRALYEAVKKAEVSDGIFGTVRVARPDVWPEDRPFKVALKQLGQYYRVCHHL